MSFRSQSQGQPRIFICGGGTGGHFFSGVALAEIFLKNYPHYRVVFIGTKSGIEGRTQLDDPRMSMEFIKAKGLKGKGLSDRILGFVFLFLGLIESLALLFRHRPKVVCGVGGYASAPTLFAAWLFQRIGGWKIALLEQNSSPGLVNRLFLKLGVQGFSAFGGSGFQSVDLPLRAKTLEVAETCSKSEWPPRTLFILGGSQGAKSLNRKWREMLPKLLIQYPQIKVIHQTGREDERPLKDFYSKTLPSAVVFAFSNEMPLWYSKADLLICRSGAMTVFEAIAFKRPCVFVPFPFATDDHQRKNALSVQEADWVIDETDFSYERVEPILRSSKPKIPSPKIEGKPWSEIFGELIS